jgi:hypothetical protein
MSHIINPPFIRIHRMAEPSAGITFKVIQEMMPEYHLSPDLLDGLMAAMPPPPAEATGAWRQQRVTRVIEEIAARVPMDPAQAHLAGQIAVVQFMADDMAGRIGTPGQTPEEMHRLVRSTDALLHTISRLERTLERRQFRVMPFRDVNAVDGFDLEVLDGAWCRRTTPASAAARVPTEIPPTPRQAAMPEPATPEMEHSPAPAASAQTQGGRDHTTTDAEGGTRHHRIEVEQGDGWSMEVWRPVAGPDAPAGPGAHGPDAESASAPRSDREPTMAGAPGRYPRAVDAIASSTPDDAGVSADTGA